MEFSILYIVSRIIIALLIFSAFYYVLLIYRYKRESHLILSRYYLNQLFKKSENPLEASQDENGDINIETVIFKPKDFQFLHELKNLEQYLSGLTNGESNQ